MNTTVTSWRDLTDQLTPGQINKLTRREALLKNPPGAGGRMVTDVRSREEFGQ